LKTHDSSIEGILKRIVLQPRPALSCIKSCGMPSGHSTQAIGFFCYLFADGAYRILPKAPRAFSSI